MCASLRVVKDETQPEPLEQYIGEVERGSTSILPYDRLMIHYRKHKLLAQELKIIKKGIATIKKFYSEQQKKVLKGKNRGSVSDLSSKIAKSTGLVDRKGKELYLPEPLPRWLKRLETVENKLAKQKSAGMKKKKKK